MIFDVETRITEKSNQSLALWLRLQACHNLVLNYVRDKMRQQFNVTLPRYDLMAQLAGQKNGLKMGELSARLMVSNGNITTITTQLEKEELIERILSTEDRRSTFVRLTPKGTKAFNKMQKAYDAYIQEAFSQFSETNTKKLQKSLSDLKKTLSISLN